MYDIDGAFPDRQWDEGNRDEVIYILTVSRQAIIVNIRVQEDSHRCSPIDFR